MSQHLSLVSGPTSKPLRTITLGALAELQAKSCSDRTALVVPWQNKRLTYREVVGCANIISKGLMEVGLQYGECVGIFAGNCSEYLEVFLGAAFIGCPVVVLNSNYTPTELESAVQFVGKSSAWPYIKSVTLIHPPECKLLCMARCPGRGRDTTSHLDKLRETSSEVRIVLFDDNEYVQHNPATITTFDDLISRGEPSRVTELALAQRKSLVRASDVLNYQFTSGRLNFSQN